MCVQNAVVCGQSSVHLSDKCILWRERERERPLGSVKLRSNCWVGVQVYFHFMFFVKIPFSLWSCCYWLKYSSIAEDFVFQVLKWKWGVALHVDQTSWFSDQIWRKCLKTCLKWNVPGHVMTKFVVNDINDWKVNYFFKFLIVLINHRLWICRHTRITKP